MERLENGLFSHSLTCYVRGFDTFNWKDCGADCAKFQKSELEHKFNQRALERPYTSKHSWGKTYGDHKRHLEFSHEQYKELQKYAKEVGIFFTASGMDEVNWQSICDSEWHRINISMKLNLED